MKKTIFVVLTISVLFFLSGCNLFNEEKINSDLSAEYTNTGGDVIAIAHSTLGCPYAWGAAGPSSFDASGLVCYCYGCKGHVWSTYTFVNQSDGWKKISASEAKPGDVVSSADHCGIYVGKGMMIHAPGVGLVVSYGPVQGDMCYYRLSI